MGFDSKDLARLGPRAQRQIVQKLGSQHRQRETREKKPNKYNARPTDVLMPDGSVHRFASEKEANRYRELELLQRAGDITNLRYQVSYQLIPHQKRDDGKTEQPCRYIADFVYNDRDGKEIAEDVKGYTDTSGAPYKLYTVKRKLMLQVWGISIKEI